MSGHMIILMSFISTSTKLNRSMARLFWFLVHDFVKTELSRGDVDKEMKGNGTPLWPTGHPDLNTIPRYHASVSYKSHRGEQHGECWAPDQCETHVTVPSFTA